MQPSGSRRLWPPVPCFRYVGDHHLSPHRRPRSRPPPLHRTAGRDLLGPSRAGSCGSTSGRTVAPQTQHPLQPKCACLTFLADNPPDGSEPHCQGSTCVLEDRACGYRHLLPTGRAHPQAPPRPPTSRSLAGRTGFPIWPSELRKRLTTSPVGAETGFEFPKSSRVVLHCQQHYL